MNYEKLCPCGKTFTGNHDLCCECGYIYGYSRSDWPAWLLFMVNDLRTERRKEIIAKKHIADFTDDPDDGDEDVLHQRESHIDDNGLLILRGCRQDTFALT